MPTFDWKSEKIELFGDLLETSLKVQNQLTEEIKINCHSLMPSDAPFIYIFFFNEIFKPSTTSTQFVNYLRPFGQSFFYA